MDWGTIALGFLAVPLAAILGTIAVVWFAISVWNKGRMAKLQIEEKERQAEIDRELLGLGSKEISANMQIILDRLNAVERRLDGVEAMQNVQAAKGRATPIPLADDTSNEAARRATEENLR